MIYIKCRLRLRSGAKFQIVLGGEGIFRPLPLYSIKFRAYLDHHDIIGEFFPWVMVNNPWVTAR